MSVRLPLSLLAVLVGGTALVGGTRPIEELTLRMPPSQQHVRSHPPTEQAPFRPDTVNAEEILSRADFKEQYPWTYDAESWPRAAMLRDVFAPPAGFERVAVDPERFGAFLRRLPLRLDRTTVHQYDGTPLHTSAAAITMLPVGDRNLQQCADAIIRLHAEYLWATGRQEDIAYHFTSGDRSAWTDWAEGERFQISGNRVERHHRASPDRSRSAFLDYLTHLFTYAGTRSLPRDAKRVPVGTPIQPGDFFLDPGSPGHVILVLDVVVSEEGRRRALLGQSFMPAQEFHVIDGGVDGTGWFRLPTHRDGTVDVPSWTAFPRTSAWRFH